MAQKVTYVVLPGAPSFVVAASIGHQGGMCSHISDLMLSCLGGEREAPALYLFAIEVAV